MSFLGADSTNHTTEQGSLNALTHILMPALVYQHICIQHAIPVGTTGLPPTYLPQAPLPGYNSSHALSVPVVHTGDAVHLSTPIHHPATPPQPFQCNVCGQSFGRQHTLQRHTRTHTGEKPFLCPTPGCEKAYTRHDALQRHLVRSYRAARVCITALSSLSTETEHMQ